jgi:rhodanese-related sulfurtransferase
MLSSTHNKYLFIIILSFFLQACGQVDQPADSTISPDQLVQLLETEETTLLIDVRTDGEFNGELGHIDNAILHPLQQIDLWKNEYEWDDYDKVIMVCRSGNRSGVATSVLKSEGYKNIYNLVGGMRSWNKEGLPVVKARENKE